MTALVDLTVIYQFVCSVCGLFHTQRYPTPRGCEIYNPGVPDGWRQIDSTLVCPKHEVKIVK